MSPGASGWGSRFCYWNALFSPDGPRVPLFTGRRGTITISLCFV